MAEPTDRDADHFEAELAQQQARRRGLIRGLGVALTLGGAVAAAIAVYFGLVARAHFASWLVASALALVGGMAGISLIIRGRAGASAESGALDDWLIRVAPRILGGRKSDAMEHHRPRHGKRRRRRRSASSD